MFFGVGSVDAKFQCSKFDATQKNKKKSLKHSNI
jgi:hypothetical protein